ncbi:hypothetical protein ACPV5U_30000, partial [Vibrio mediterranei]
MEGGNRERLRVFVFGRRPLLFEEWLSSAQSLKKSDLVKQLDSWLNGRDDSLTEKQQAHFSQWMPLG